MKWHEPIFPQKPIIEAITITDTQAVAEQNLIIAGDDGILISSISATSTDTVDKWVKIFINNGLISFLLGEILVKDGSGTNGTDPATDLLNPTSLPFLPEDKTLAIKAGWRVTTAMKTALSTGKTMTIIAFAGDYAK